MPILCVNQIGDENTEDLICVTINQLNSNLIKIARKAKGYSQENVAMDLELSQSQYSRRENGSINFSLDEIKKLCEILDLDIHQTVTSLINVAKSSEMTPTGDYFDSKSADILHELDNILSLAQSLVSQLQRTLNSKDI